MRITYVNVTFGGSIGIGPIGQFKTGSVILLNSQVDEGIDNGFTKTRDQIFRGVFEIVIAGKFRGSQSTLRLRGEGIEPASKTNCLGYGGQWRERKISKCNR